MGRSQSAQEKESQYVNMVKDKSATSFIFTITTGRHLYPQLLKKGFVKTFPHSN
jgi:hypothetical protein